MNNFILPFRLKGLEPDCPDSCAYTKDGGPPDEIWCFKTATNVAIYPATNICPDITTNPFTTLTPNTTQAVTSQSTLKTGSTPTPKVVSTTAGVETVTTKKVRFKLI